MNGEKLLTILQLPGKEYQSKEVHILRKLLIVAILIMISAQTFAEAKHEPYKAVLLSALIPGGGQVYNHAWLKAGLVFGVQGALIGSAIYHDGKRDEFYQLALQTSDANLAAQYMAQSKDYKANLNNDVWWIGITAGLSVLDAYVDANLYDFKEQKEKIRVRFNEGKVTMQIRF
jgi:hypothetical protein